MKKIESIIKELEEYGAKWPMFPSEMRLWRGVGPLTLKLLQERRLVHPWPEDERKCLSYRAQHCLHDFKIFNKEQAIEAINSGKLSPENRQCRNYGWVTHKQVCKWAGLPEPARIVQKPAYREKLCPHCGKNIYRW